MNKRTLNMFLLTCILLTGIISVANSTIANTTIQKLNEDNNIVNIYETNVRDRKINTTETIIDFNSTYTINSNVFNCTEVVYTTIDDIERVLNNNGINITTTESYIADSGLTFKKKTIIDENTPEVISNGTRNEWLIGITNNRLLYRHNETAIIKDYEIQIRYGTTNYTVNHYKKSMFIDALNSTVEIDMFEKIMLINESDWFEITYLYNGTFVEAVEWNGTHNIWYDEYWNITRIIEGVQFLKIYEIGIIPTLSLIVYRSVYTILVDVNNTLLNSFQLSDDNNKIEQILIYSDLLNKTSNIMEEENTREQSFFITMIFIWFFIVIAISSHRENY